MSINYLIDAMSKWRASRIKNLSLYYFYKTNRYISKISFVIKKNLLPLFVNQRTMSIKKATTDKQQRIARYAKAMGHPVRMYVLELLSKQSCCYSGDLSEDLPIAKSTLSQHLKELRDAGLIQGEIESPRIRYCLNKDNWKETQLLFKEFLGF